MITRAELEAIAVENPLGFTVDKNGKKISKGFAVALTNGIDEFNEVTVDEAIGVVELVDGWNLGGWLHNGKLILDVVMVTDILNDAVSIGKEHRQMAIYDLTNDKQIDL